MKASELWRLDWLLAFVLTLSGAARAPAQSDPPEITAPPQSQTLPAASTVTFTVTATGTEPLFFQWRKDGTNLANGGKITGATTASLTISNAQGSDMGFYSAVVTNAQGSVTSSEASLALWPAAAWGYDNYGQSILPTGLTNVTALAGGYSHSVALKADGTVVAWGRTNYGQTRVPAEATNGIALAAGAYHSLVLRADGRVVGWGDNRAGQASVPADLSNVVAVGRRC